MKRITALIAAAAMVLTMVQPSVAQDAFNPDLMPQGEKSGVFQVGELGANEIASAIIASARNSEDQWTCVSALDPECVDSKVAFVRGYAVLPPCDSPTDQNCVVKLEVAAKDQDFQPATYIRSLGGKPFPATPRLNFYEQGTPSLWDAPHAPSAAGATGYAVIVRASQEKTPGRAKFQTESFFASVVPYREEVNPKCETPDYRTMTEDQVKGTRKRSIGLHGHGAEFAWSDVGVCGVTQDFAEGTRVRLTIRIASEVGGWFQGRIKNPLISVTAISNTNNEVTVEAEPAIVQRMRYEAPDTKLLTANERRYASGGFGGSWDRFTVWFPASETRTFEFLNYFKPKVKDTAVGQNSFWNFGSTSGSSGSGPCLSDKTKVLGIVTTNALVYDGGVPKFSRGFLNYKVAGLHFEADGVTEVLGSYDLVMRSEVARCLYGFSKAPVSATITISGEGDRSIATTIVGEKNGWLKLAAYGFTFSQKTIQVKLTQPRRSTITCVSSQSPTRTTKVSGVNPKCPTGFKKR